MQIHTLSVPQEAGYATPKRYLDFNSRVLLSSVYRFSKGYVSQCDEFSSFEQLPEGVSRCDERNVPEARQ